MLPSCVSHVCLFLACSRWMHKLVTPSKSVNHVEWQAGINLCMSWHLSVCVLCRPLSALVFVLCRPLSALWHSDAVHHIFISVPCSMKQQTINYTVLGILKRGPKSAQMLPLLTFFVCRIYWKQQPTGQVNLFIVSITVLPWNIIYKCLIWSVVLHSFLLFWLQVSPSSFSATNYIRLP